MDIRGKTALVLGGAGLVGTAVCRELIAERPARLVLAARRRDRAEAAVGRLAAEQAAAGVELVPAWGDVFLRAEWQREDGTGRAEVLGDAARRARLVDDILEVMDEDIVDSSHLVRLVAGEPPADVVVDCMNTATAVSYQNVYAEAARIREAARGAGSGADLPGAVDHLLATLSLPMLVRHMQLLNTALRRAGTEGYVKVGTTGSGGYGFNIPYTHGEERPSRLLLGKAAVAGAQAQLIFMMARTPGGPALVKQVTPAACIGWRTIGHGPIGRHGRTFERWDCPPEQAVPVAAPASLAAEGPFGERVAAALEGVFIDTGENGVFTADEFRAITAPGQMQLVTAEEIGAAVVRELRGASTGHETVAALDAAVMGPSHRGGHLREVALEQLRALEARHGASVAFEILGPPRLSKLLFEAHLLRACCGGLDGVLAETPEALSARLESTIHGDAELRQRAVSIGIGVLLADGERLLRGPVLKADNAEDGWIDVGAANAGRWQGRVRSIRDQIAAERAGEPSSRPEHQLAGSWAAGVDELIPGDAVAWILTHEERGRRQKC